MSYVLGISGFFHDSAAALLKDGEIVAAVQEERFSRIKNDSAFPQQALNYCLSEAGITPDQLDWVSYYEKPLLKFDRLISSYMHTAPKGFPSFIKAVPLWLNKKFFVQREIDEALGNKYQGPIGYCTHHQSHAASAYFPSPFEKAAVITFDGVGEWSTTTWGVGHGNQIELKNEIRFPHSIGLLYSAFTYFCGFKVNSGEYKLMGLAPYGEPKYVDLILDNLLEIKPDGSFKLNLDYFSYISGLRMTSKKFSKLFDKEPRKPDSMITQKDMDIAASIQVITEKIILSIAKHVKKETGLNQLCLAGGVALNCVANGKILSEKIFDDIWIQPAAGDAGGALGSALFTHYQHNSNSRSLSKNKDSQKGSYLGPQYPQQEVKTFLESKKAKFYELTNDEIVEKVSQGILNNQVVGHFHGRMEYGPRALGSRSILGNAKSPEMQKQINLKIKYRESFRPFAPICLEEDTKEFFDIESTSPYMLLVAPVKSKRLKEKTTNLQGLDKLNEPGSNLPAITHVDGSARVQTVDKDSPSRVRKVLELLKKSDGEGICINTSFNVRGEPIVMTPEDAYNCFMNTEMDILAIENCLLVKSEQVQVDS